MILVKMRNQANARETTHLELKKPHSSRQTLFTPLLMNNQLVLTQQTRQINFKRLKSDLKPAVGWTCSV